MAKDKPKLVPLIGLTPEVEELLRLERKKAEEQQKRTSELVRKRLTDFYEDERQEEENG